jgi:hypothetical protein
MNLDLVDKITNAVLYEGYMLYPYRPSAVKNQQRWNFGVLYPQAYCVAQGGTESSSMQTECLVVSNDATLLEVRIRFLQLLERQIGKVSDSTAENETGESVYYPVETLEVDGQLFQSWQEALEREVMVPGMSIRDLEREPQITPFSFEASRQSEPLRDAAGQIVGVVVRDLDHVAGSITLSASRENDDGPAKLTVQIINRTELEDVASAVNREAGRDRALRRATISTHTILGVQNGEFVSQLDPPEELLATAPSCRNIGTWPVLVGAEGDRNTMLSSPIILYDYPQIAPESAGNLFDGTEIDEILTLRIMTLTDEEKREMRGADERAREILERTETLPIEQLMKMHGAVRGLKRMKAEG